MDNKLMTVSEAVQKFVRSRMLIAEGGFTASRGIVIFAKEILRQRRKGNINANDLVWAAFGASFSPTLLIAEGVIDSVISTFASFSRAGSNKVVRDALEKGIPRKIKWEEESNLTLNMRLLAGGLNIPFIPSKSGLWGDLKEPGLWDGSMVYPKNITMEDPYGSGEKVALLQALRPDLSVIHVAYADTRGNGIILGATYADNWIARAGKSLILIADHIVDTDMCRQYPNLVSIPGVGVDAVVPWYFGAWPSNSVGVYREDEDHIIYFAKSLRGGSELRDYIEKYVYSWETHEEYMELIGKDNVARLEDDPSCRLSEPFKKWIYDREKINLLLSQNK